MRETILLLALASANGGLALRIMEPMLPRIAGEFGTSISATASVITAFAIGYACGQLLHGPLGDRFGKLRVVTISLSGAALGFLACALAQGVSSLAVLRFVSAVFASASTTLGMAYIGDRIPIAERQLTIARFLGGTIIGQALGPFVGGLFTDLIGWRATFVLVAFVFAAVSIILFARTRSEWAQASGPASGDNPFSVYLRVLALPRVRVVISTAFADGFLFFGAYSFLGAFLKLKFDLSLTAIGAILAGFGVGGVLYTLTVRRLLLVLGQRGLVVWGGAICFGAYAIMVLSPIWELAMPCAVALGFSFFMLHNTVQTKATEMAPHARGAAVSVFASTWSLGQAAGVAAMGLAVSLIDYAPAIIGFGLGFLALGAWMRGNLHRL
jgi:predicted MFS family arabinose efflux permease